MVGRVEHPVGVHAVRAAGPAARHLIVVAVDLVAQHRIQVIEFLAQQRVAARLRPERADARSFGGHGRAQCGPVGGPRLQFVDEAQGQLGGGLAVAVAGGLRAAAARVQDRCDCLDIRGQRPVRIGALQTGGVDAGERLQGTLTQQLADLLPAVLLIPGAR